MGSAAPSAIYRKYDLTQDRTFVCQLCSVTENNRRWEFSLRQDLVRRELENWAEVKWVILMAVEQVQIEGPIRPRLSIMRPRKSRKPLSSSPVFSNRPFSIC